MVDDGWWKWWKSWLKMVRWYKDDTNVAVCSALSALFEALSHPLRAPGNLTDADRPSHGRSLEELVAFRRPRRKGWTNLHGLVKPSSPTLVYSHSILFFVFFCWFWHRFGFYLFEGNWSVPDVEAAGSHGQLQGPCDAEQALRAAHAAARAERETHLRQSFAPWLWVWSPWRGGYWNWKLNTTPTQTWKKELNKEDKIISSQKHWESHATRNGHESKHRCLHSCIKARFDKIWKYMFVEHSVIEISTSSKISWGQSIIGSSRSCTTSCLEMPRGISGRYVKCRQFH